MGRRRRDPETCPGWYGLITGVTVTRSVDGRYRAVVQTLIQGRDPAGEDAAVTICARTFVGLPGGGVANMSGSVRVLMLDGHIIAHNNFGRCTAGFI